MTETAVDLNNSGNTDLVISTFADGYWNNAILTGNGTGGFVLTTSDVPSPAADNKFESLLAPWAFVDTNRDGYTDNVSYDGGYYVYDPVNGCDYSQTQNGQIYVSLGDGHGNFTLNPTATMEMQPATNISAVIGDFNGDGLKDVALLTSDNQECAPAQSFLYILLNNGDGTFTMRQVNMTIYGTSLVTGDFNGDGKLDLVFLGQVGLPQNTYSPIQVLYGNGDGTFRAGPIYKVNTSASSNYSIVSGLVASDLNGDGKTDLVAFIESKNPTGPTSIATLLAKQSGGGFYWYSEVSGANLVIPVGLMDLNNDGKPDLVYYSYNSSGTVSMRANPGLGGGKFGSSRLIRNLAPNENDIIAPLRTGGPLDIFYALSYPPNKNVYLYEMLNQSK